MIFSEIYCINLDERQDRWLYQDEQAKRFGYKLNRWPAIKHERGVIGCHLSHMSLLNHIHLEVCEPTLIIEDDVQFLQNPTGVVCPIEKWDAIYFAVNADPRLPKPIKTIYPCWYRLQSGFNTAAYVVTPRGAKYFREIATKHYSATTPIPVDVNFSQFVIPTAPNGVYSTWPLVAIQTPGYSDIEKQEVDYKWMIARWNEATGN